MIMRNCSFEVAPPRNVKNDRRANGTVMASSRHGARHGLPVFPNEDGRVLARGEIVARLEVRDLADEPDEFLQLGQISRDGVASAH